MVCGEKQKFDGTENKFRLISRGEGGPVTSEQTVWSRAITAESGVVPVEIAVLKIIWDGKNILLRCVERPHLRIRGTCGLRSPHTRTPGWRQSCSSPEYHHCRINFKIFLKTNEIFYIKNIEWGLNHLKQLDQVLQVGGGGDGWWWHAGLGRAKGLL